MWHQVARRLLLCPIILWAIYTLTFVMVVSVPGNPFKMGERALDEASEIAIKARYRADDNWTFYFDYLKGLFQPVKAIRGLGPLIDFGPSWQYADWNCNQIIGQALPVSVGLGLTAMLLATIIGIPIGVLSAVHRDSWLDFLILSFALLGISLPTFVTGIALLILFSICIPIFPLGGWGHLSQIILPAITLSLPFMAYISRLTRLGMLDVLNSDFIRTARAKGLSEGVVIWKHALKNAILPVVSYLGPACAMAFTGSFVVEKIFNIPGMGTHFVNSILNRDRAMILGTVLVYSVLIILFNLITDIVYAIVDPRIQTGKV